MSRTLYLPPEGRSVGLHWLVAIALTGLLLWLIVAAGYLSVISLVGWGKAPWLSKLGLIGIIGGAWSLVVGCGYALARWFRQLRLLWFLPLVIAITIALWLLA